jgi:hypothetical protein
MKWRFGLCSHDRPQSRKLALDLQFSAAPVLAREKMKTVKQKRR